MNKTIIGILLFAAGILIGVYTAGTFRDNEHQQVQATSISGDVQGGEKKILYWVAPMDPNYRRDRPGKSPMGMDLIPVYEGEENGSDDDAATVKISPEVVNNLGVRTEKVTRGDLWQKINTVGYLDYDENLIVHVHTRTDGWIEKLLVRAEGEYVDKEQLIFELYSPQLVNAQEEYVQALATGNASLKSASHDRLIALDISESQIRQLEKDRKVSQYVKWYAPRSGVMASLKVRQGMYVTPSNEIMSIASLDHVWLMVEVFERQASWVSIGQTAEAILPSMPGEVWEGKVEYIYPDLDLKTRTLQVRLRFENPDEVLKPNMFAHVAINSGAKRNVLSVPREALIREGQNQRVILAMGEGRFMARNVVAGIESGDRVEIKSGLEEGEEIVVSSQFLLDSESSLKASMRRMEPVAMDEGNGGMGAMGAMDRESGGMTEMETDDEIMAMGTVKEVMADQRKLNITHEPIEELGWPTMTMDFLVNDDVELENVKPGSRIHFALEQDGDRYVISFIHVMGN